MYLFWYYALLAYHHNYIVYDGDATTIDFLIRLLLPVFPQAFAGLGIKKKSMAINKTVGQHYNVTHYVYQVWLESINHYIDKTLFITLDNGQRTDSIHILLRIGTIFDAVYSSISSLGPLYKMTTIKYQACTISITAQVTAFVPNRKIITQLYRENNTPYFQPIWKPQGDLPII